MWEVGSPPKKSGRWDVGLRKWEVDGKYFGRWENLPRNCGRWEVTTPVAPPLILTEVCSDFKYLA